MLACSAQNEQDKHAKKKKKMIWRLIQCDQTCACSKHYAEKEIKAAPRNTKTIDVPFTCDNPLTHI